MARGTRVQVGRSSGQDRTQPPGSASSQETFLTARSVSGTRPLKAARQATEASVCLLARNGSRDQLPNFLRTLATRFDAFDIAVSQPIADRAIDGSSGFGLADMSEKQCERADRGDRTCYSFARVFGRAAVDRLEDRDLARVDVARRCGAETARERGAEVREDVAEEIRRDHDVELLRLEDHPHRGGVDVYRIATHVGELRADLLEHVAP